MDKEISTDSSYLKLVSDMKKEIQEGYLRAQEAYDKEKIKTYWKIGQIINKHFLENKIQAEYGKKIFNNLSQDLNINKRSLYQIVEFYKKYPVLEPSDNLKWTHYRTLLQVKDDNIRNQLEEKASIENLSKRNLETLVKNEKQKINILKLENEPKQKIEIYKPKKLRVNKGRLYIYKLEKNKYSDKAELTVIRSNETYPRDEQNYFIDLGFYISKESEIKNPKEHFIQSIKTEIDYDIKYIKAIKTDLYTYKAIIIKIIDGDTIWVNIDLGFKIWIKHKIRLRGIQTPEIETKDGQESYKYVKNLLHNIPFIIVKSHGRDKYDRYLMDVYYKPNEENPEKVLEEGNFLNQELLNNKLAEIY